MINWIDVKFAVQCGLHKVSNFLLNPCGLYTTWTSYYDTIEQLSDEALVLADRAVVDRLHLASLLGERFGWDINWTEGEVTFTVQIPSAPLVEYRQDLEHIDKVLADVKFRMGLPLSQIASQEVQA